MSSVYGDLILQDGARIINKSGNVFTDFSQKITKGNLTLIIQLNIDTLTNDKTIAPCTFVQNSKNVTLYINPFTLTSTDPVFAFFFTLSGIPKNFKPSLDTKINGGVFLNDVSGNSFVFIDGYAHNQTSGYLVNFVFSNNPGQSFQSGFKYNCSGCVLNYTLP
ncbi:hypothetical protein ACTFIR_011879 [Dictyostelium discoideum]